MKQQTKTNIAILTLGILLIGTITWTGIANAQKYENPTIFWCNQLHQNHLNYSCDWENDTLPKTAIKYWHQGMNPKQAHQKAIQQQEEENK